LPLPFATQTPSSRPKRSAVERPLYWHLHLPLFLSFPPGICCCRPWFYVAKLGKLGALRVKAPALAFLSVIPSGNLLLPLSLLLPFFLSFRAERGTRCAREARAHPTKINSPDHSQKQPKIFMSTPRHPQNLTKPSPPLPISLSATWHSYPHQRPTIELAPKISQNSFSANGRFRGGYLHT
jgi:hypothetical protein